jgi:hypothetical protein
MERPAARDARARAHEWAGLVRGGGSGGLGSAEAGRGAGRAAPGCGAGLHAGAARRGGAGRAFTRARTESRET